MEPERWRETLDVVVVAWGEETCPDVVSGWTSLPVVDAIV